MKKTIVKFAGLIGLALSSSGTASAYTGPGLGFASIAVALGFIASIFVAIFAILWYPFKRMLKSRKKTSPKLSTEIETIEEPAESIDQENK